MIITRYLCSMLNVDWVQLPDGETLTSSDPAVNARVYGMYVTAGAYEITASDEAQHIGTMYSAGTGFVPATIKCAASATAHGDTVWFCCSQNDDTRREVSLLTVEGNATLPAGHGFFVASGEVQADGKTATQFRFFRPRPVDLEITGNGVLLVVR